MEILFKKKPVEIIEKIGDNSYKCVYKNQTYFLRQFKDKTSFSNYLENKKYLRNSGIFIAKVQYKDKKQFLVFEEFIDGENALELLAKGPLNEEYYKSIYSIAFRNKIERILLDYKPENFKLVSKKLIYLSDRYFRYQEKENFINKDVYYWFYSKELLAYFEEKGISTDNLKLKEEYELNKEIVLTTIKYYM